MTFQDVVIECSKNAEFVSNFNRLSGHSLGKSQSRQPIEIMIDDACGVSGESNDDMKAFVEFVFEYVWMRLPIHHANELAIAARQNQ